MPSRASKPATKPKTGAAKAPVKKVAQPKRERGRPSTFNQAVADAICERLSKGEPLANICRDDNMPAVRTVSDWKTSHEAFSASFVRAREEGFDHIAAECLEIADETDNDTITGENGDRANTEWIARSKLRIETRLKLLAKWDPKRYGDKVDINHGGQENNPVQVRTKVVLVPMKQKVENIIKKLGRDSE